MSDNVVETDTVVEVRGVSKRYGTRLAVDGLDLSVARNQCLGLLGPNGAGKTTTLRMIYGVARPSEGTVRVFGMDVSANVRAVRRRLGVTLQENVLIETLTPRENLKVFGRYFLLREPELSARADELLDFLDLRSHADVLARRLSGGFRRRLAVAMSLMNRPELLILDEPTTGLDPAVRHALWSRVRSLRSAGTTVLLTTHYMDEAERLCDSVVIMANGHAVSEGAPRVLIDRHLAREAMEIDCDEREERELFGDLIDQSPTLRLENRLMIFADDAAPFVNHLRAREGGDRRPMVVRPANLEDVFLAVTGAKLEGGV